MSGTDTDVGKSVVSAILLAGLKGRYWKPIQSGLEDETDTEKVQRMAGLSDDDIFTERYRLNEPLSPHASAEIDGVEMSLEDFSLPSSPDRPLLVEGAGGLLVPLNRNHLVVDLVQYLNLPLVLVVRSSLGTINHTLLSIEALRRRGIELLGVIMNGELNPSNRKAIEHYGETTVLAEIPPLDRFDPQHLEEIYKEAFSPQGVLCS